jgi:riboflavin biosynthesis pyrimidine reductase
MAGLVDELSIHLIPVLFGSGTPIFTDPRETHVQLKPVHTVETPEAVHLRLRIVK